MEITPIGGTIEAGSPAVEISIDGGAPASVPMSGSGSSWTATLPAFDCDQEISIAFTARLQGGGEYRDPPVGGYDIDVITDLVIAFEDDMESGTNGWTTSNDGATSGAWELVDPIATTSAGLQYAPGDAASGTFCWVTQNGLPGAVSYTHLTLPTKA